MLLLLGVQQGCQEGVYGLRVVGLTLEVGSTGAAAATDIFHMDLGHAERGRAGEDTPHNGEGQGKERCGVLEREGQKFKRKMKKVGG